jgi:hypothetical protein
MKYAGVRFGVPPFFDCGAKQNGDKKVAVDMFRCHPSFLGYLLTDYSSV